MPILKLDKKYNKLQTYTFPYKTNNIQDAKIPLTCYETLKYTCIQLISGYPVIHHNQVHTAGLQQDLHLSASFPGIWTMPCFNVHGLYSHCLWLENDQGAGKFKAGMLLACNRHFNMNALDIFLNLTKMATS